MSELAVVPSTEIVVTASRALEDGGQTPASVTLIGTERIERLGEPLAVSFLRQVPSLAISTSGAAGSVTEVRIRGAEANHTLLFIDGIRANDPAAGNVPRFELLNSDLLSRIEVVRGPQSALWGPEAIGGVVAVSGGDAEGSRAVAEAGSFGFARLGGGTAFKADSLTVDAAAGLQRARGINAFDSPGGGERDGYRNLSTRGRLSWAAAKGVELGVSGFASTGRSEFDGYDPLSFQRADTLDSSRNRLAAGRLWGSLTRQDLSLSAWASKLGSRNRNLLDEVLVNVTHGGRTNAGLQGEVELRTGKAEHQLIAAAEATRETFRSRNPADPFADQEQNRRQNALVGEVRSRWAEWLATDVAVRRDMFNRFQDRTTLRASALVEPVGGVQLSAGYSEGIAQPSFFDLFGYYPGFFVGNPNLKPERSRGWEVSARLDRGAFRGALTAYRQRLTDEIVSTADFGSTENADGRSKRRGVEAELGWSPSERLNLTATYALLDAEERLRSADQSARELRRPRHSGSVAADGRAGRLTYGASLAFVGKHRDRRDSLPYELVDLDSYWLAGARLGWRLDERLELFGRLANAFDADYQDLVGYRTEGRSAYAGLRVALGR
ncbi:TonB-dependent siderophore receptor [uncultured Sphingomonas sp.]|uniref:TonB-dependent receptor plug domain-containing protein n=1 Tax=uncultured Sphingomonas sp. TaxID=158754 RepID=UPI0025D01055|nr:TonB-dependent receptor [uncultured Sphingomonas sp.]